MDFRVFFSRFRVRNFAANTEHRQEKKKAKYFNSRYIARSREATPKFVWLLSIQSNVTGILDNKRLTKNYLIYKCLWSPQQARTKHTSTTHSLLVLFFFSCSFVQFIYILFLFLVVAIFFSSPAYAVALLVYLYKFTLVFWRNIVKWTCKREAYVRECESMDWT